MFLFKVTPLSFTHLANLSCHVWNTNDRPFSLSSLQLAFMAFIISWFDSNLRPRRAFFTSGNSQKSQGARLELYGGCGMIWILFFVKKIGKNTSDMWTRIVMMQVNLFDFLFWSFFSKMLDHFLQRVLVIGCCDRMACRYHILVYKNRPRGFPLRTLLL